MRHCRETLSNAKLTAALVDIVKAHGLESGCNKATAALIVQVGSTLPPSAAPHRPLLVRKILSRDIASNDQCTAAIKYLKAHAADSEIDEAEFDKASGVGVVVSDADVAAAVAAAMAQSEAAIKEERYRFNFRKLLQPIKASGDMAWADIARVMAEIDKQKVQMLGPETEEDRKPAEKPKGISKKAKPPKVLLRHLRSTARYRPTHACTVCTWQSCSPPVERLASSCRSRRRTRTKRQRTVRVLTRKRGVQWTRIASCRRRRRTRARTSRSRCQTAA
jgi:Glutaminyl-tRNA synthetase, non-specific RNA binding region part 1